MSVGRAVAFLLAVLVLVGCRNSKITSLDRDRGAPGETFTIHGEDLDNFAGPDPVAPVIRRCTEFSLEVVQWFDDDVRVKIPPNVPAGVYDVYAFGQPTGAYKRGRTNSLPFWVTPASVSDSVTDRYEVQVRAVRNRYGKSMEWENWMLANGDRYRPVFAAAHALPCPLSIDVSYETPLAYNPPWTSEAEHMTALNRMGDLEFPGYHFDFRLGRDTPGAYAQAVLGHVRRLERPGPDRVPSLRDDLRPRVRACFESSPSLRRHREHRGRSAFPSGGARLHDGPE